MNFSDLPFEAKCHIFSFLDYLSFILQKGLCLNKTFCRSLLYAIEPPKKLLFGPLPKRAAIPIQTSDDDEIDGELDEQNRHSRVITFRYAVIDGSQFYDRITNILLPKYLKPMCFNKTITYLDIHTIGSKLTMKQTIDICKEFPNLTQVHFINHFPTLSKLKSFILDSLYPQYCAHLRVIDITSGELASQNQTVGNTVKKKVTPIQRLRSEEDFPAIVDYALLVLPNTASASGTTSYLKMNDEQTLTFLKQLIEKYYVPINTCIQGKYTFLSGACHNSHFECIKYLLNFGANLRQNRSKSKDSISRSISLDLMNIAESSEKELLLLRSQPNRALYFSFKRNFCIAPLVILQKENIIDYLIEKGITLCEYQIASIIQHLRRSLANLSFATPEMKLKIIDKKKKQEQLLYKTLNKLEHFLFTFSDVDMETGSSPIHQILDYTSLRIILHKMGLHSLQSSPDALSNEVEQIINTTNKCTGASVIHMLCASSSSLCKVYQPTSISEIINALSVYSNCTNENSNFPLSPLDTEIFSNIQNFHHFLKARLDIYDLNGMMPIHLCVDMERYDLAKEWLKWKPEHALFLTKNTNESILHILVEQFTHTMFDLSASSSDDEASYRKCMNSHVVLESPASPSDLSSIPEVLEENLLEQRRIELQEKERTCKLNKILSLIKFIATGLKISEDERRKIFMVQNDLNMTILDNIHSSFDEYITEEATDHEEYKHYKEYVNEVLSLLEK
ncbi:hypothetical protein FDP41_003942 [Naegleria fowleri]|uniref:Uncharacterized protein n=1 Tax=Naegleria fowleri TaxID=5763 RepID=A0A6A5BWJ0_NAEFO|nr:uncharacterized protein FDP41_003942 [Naegleria fowleri]KAF0977289.1 hypothetical protein FDP41_003942 [Naegleria fowleri]